MKALHKTLRRNFNNTMQAERRRVVIRNRKEARQRFVDKNDNGIYEKDGDGDDFDDMLSDNGSDGDDDAGDDVSGDGGFSDASAGSDSDGTEDTSTADPATPRLPSAKVAHLTHDLTSQSDE